MSDKTLLRLEAAGAFIVFILASLLHFVYDLSPSVLTSLFGAVNESIWEHIKIFAFSYLFYAVVEFLWVKPVLKKFTVAKTAGVYVQSIFIPAVYYCYHFFVGKPVLIIDLLIGFSAATLGFFVSYRLYVSDKEIEKYFYTALMAIFLLLMMLFCFTYFPPETELFRDVVTGTYGVPSESLDMGAFALSEMRNTDVLN